MLFVDREEERAGVLEHCLADIIRGDSGTQVCDLPHKTQIAVSYQLVLQHCIEINALFPGRC